MTRVVFICASGLHVRLFSPVITLLVARGEVAPLLYSEDRFYRSIHGDAGAAAARLGVPVVDIAIDAPATDANTLWRHLDLVRRVAIDGYRRLRNMLVDHEARLVVLGNDTGHIERAAIRAARGLEVPTLLVQDGYAAFPRKGGRGLAGMPRALYTATAGRFFGGIDYGTGGCTAIAVTGEHWKTVFRNNARSVTRQIVVTGSAVYEASRRSLAAPDADARDRHAPRTLVFFCTNFATGYGDADEHRHQVMQIIELHRRLQSRYGDTLRLLVKPHPADARADYLALNGLGRCAVAGDDDAQQVIASAWLGITNISSASLLCAAAGKICVNATMLLDKRRYRELAYDLPGRRCDDWDEFFRLLDDVVDERRYRAVADDIRRELAPYVDEQPGAPAAGRLADLVTTLCQAR